MRRMQWVATGLLVLAALVYAAAAWFEPRHPWLFYVSATAEAAMIGAIADWFAVTALFRHPLNLRFIPHTAVIPRNKARIASGLSAFLQQNFLSSEAVVARIAAFHPARTLCGWLMQPASAGMLAGYLARLLAYAAGAVDDARVRGFLLRTVAQAARRADIASALAQLLDVLTENRRHHALLDEALASLDDLLAREDTRRFIAREVAGSAPLLKYLSDLFHLKLDERAALRIVDVALRKLTEVRQDRDHELRARFDAFVLRFVEKLKSDGAMRERVHRLRDEVLDSPALAGYVGGLWDELRAWLRDEQALMEAKGAAWLSQFGELLQADAAIQQWLDEQILAAIPPLVEEHRAGIGRFVEDQINAWQETRLVEELERHVGADLQYIRINGTVVGGLVGLAIAVATRLVV
ncbi:MAG TPA: DUF445 domain-containing protein [Burkholderiales bacterium]|nr:DUF445 domain-containing protein [Burkholderiales bacterium]